MPKLSETARKVAELFASKFKFLNERFTQFQNEYKDTWDIQWYFTCTKNNWLTMTPETNLVTNIGIKGTHSNKYYDTLHLKTGRIDYKELKGPSQIKNNEDFRDFIEKFKIYLDIENIRKKL